MACFNMVTAIFLLPCIILCESRHEISRHCYTKGDRGARGDTMILCSVCSVHYDLGSNHFPRYTTEIECKPDQNNQKFCFQGEGYCIQRSTIIFIQKKKADGTMENIYYTMHTGCECECRKTSFLTNLI
ncbi:uncharacterized protein [Clytia hemisphaerica]|uniref:Cnidarian restricted protein n=1 Tax=Clytia hemisphaerica TaxID=252671 RepID=A0A7M5WJM9_9CNID